MSNKGKAPETVRAVRGPKNLLGGGSDHIVPQNPQPQVPGRLDTYRSRGKHWHRQVRVDECPKCGHPHLHRAPLPVVKAVAKTAPCGMEYVVVLRTAVAA